MLFNSLSFAIFLPVVFSLYWVVTKNRLKWQNILLLVSSYYFYASWDYRFLFLLAFSTILDFVSGIKIQNAETSFKRKFWLTLSICINLGFLGLFKYFNFFSSSFAGLLNAVGISADWGTLNLILPVGISFYTFHGLSYIIDIYNRKIPAEKNLVVYSLFVSFFPLLVAGPIERATHLLPQLQNERKFNYSGSVDGLKRILWGMFKKIVIADNCARYVNLVFGDLSNQPGSSLAIAAVFFAFQIYCDFSGYSDIALGTARLFGINLLENFSYPYFSRDIAEFWRRWHISLTTWFRDYVYIPLGGSRGNKWTTIRNTFIIFLVSGFWHGANWTFILWGVIHAFFFLPLLLAKRNRTNLEIVAKGVRFPSFQEFFGIIATFCLTTLAWIFFRADSVKQGFYFLQILFSRSLFITPDLSRDTLITCVLLVGLILIEWHGREQPYAIKQMWLTWPRFVRLSLYYCIIFLIFYFAGAQQKFIYFQF